MEKLMEEQNSLEEFRALGLSETTLKALEKKGFREPTEIQKACIPLLLEKDVDVIGQARTGTGKTAAFALPILEKLDISNKATQALVLTPTRELAIQVAAEIGTLKGDRRITVEPIYGGSGYENQFRLLKKGIQIVVGTPGRIQDHLERGTLDLSALSFAVLDEADEMLDMGFIEDIEKILSHTNDDKRMLFFSATMPQQIMSLALQFMSQYEIVKVAGTQEESHLTHQYACFLKEADKPEVLTRIIDSAGSFYGIVFCKTKLQCDEIGKVLSSKGYNAEALHGDLSQKQREIIISRMRDHKISILVATDVAARGIDISELTHVINYTVPSDPEVYTHRIGRTGRAGKSGVAITFVTGSEKKKLAFIRRVNKDEIEDFRIPSADEIIQAKKERIIASVRHELEKECSDFDDVCDSLLSFASPDAVVRALLKLRYGRELDKSQYQSISSTGLMKEERSKAGRADDKSASTARLFFAVGRKDHFTKRTLANTIISKCHVHDRDLMDIQVMESFSFVNVPSRLASHILSVFSTSGEGGRPLAVIAKPEKETGGKKEVKAKKRSNAVTRRQRRNWEDEIQFYGADSYDEDYAPRQSKKKAHGKYNVRKKKKN